MGPGLSSAVMKGGRVRIGVSSCLLGDAVRFDGGHKRDAFLADELAAFVELVRVCPELELGLGVPRAAIRLESASGQIALVEPQQGTDHTAAMKRFARQRVRQLERLGLSGYVLKCDSPSCGLEGVEVWHAHGRRRREGRGLFAAELLQRLPDLPVEDERRLGDPSLREHFLERVFTYQRLHTPSKARGPKRA